MPVQYEKLDPTQEDTEDRLVILVMVLAAAGIVLGAAALIILGLRLTGLDLSWWWVLAPFVPVALAVPVAAYTLFKP